jgi:hypothetical protein
MCMGTLVCLLLLTALLTGLTDTEWLLFLRTVQCDVNENCWLTSANTSAVFRISAATSRRPKMIGLVVFS